jgi:hypothetical protein
MTPDDLKRGSVVLIFGATGTAGAGALQACLDEPAVAEVRAVTRRPLGVSHPKIREVSCSDVVNLSGLARAFKGVDCCLFCLGTSVRNVHGEDECRTSTSPMRSPPPERFSPKARRDVRVSLGCRGEARVMDDVGTGEGRGGGAARATWASPSRERSPDRDSTASAEGSRGEPSVGSSRLSQNDSRARDR